MADYQLNGVAARIFKPLSGSVLSLCDEVRRQAMLGQPELAQLVRNYAFVAYPRHPMLIHAGSELPLEYNRAFYSQIDAFGTDSAQIMLRVLRDRYRFRSVLDVGAGSGTWLNEARKCGATRLCGIEGLWYTSYPVPAETCYWYCDLNNDFPKVEERFDLVLCLEVAEHLLPESSEALVSHLCSCGSVILFGAALERQYGNAHCNCRRQEFWIERFRSHGFECFDLFKPELWHCDAVAPWYRQNSLLLVHHSASARFASLRPPAHLNVYHPQLLFYPVDEYVKMDQGYDT